MYLKRGFFYRIFSGRIGKYCLFIGSGLFWVLGIIGSFSRLFFTFISSFCLFRIQELSDLFIFSFHLFMFSKYAKKYRVVFSHKKGNLHLRTFLYPLVLSRTPSYPFVFLRLSSCPFVSLRIFLPKRKNTFNREIKKD